MELKKVGSFPLLRLLHMFLHMNDDEDSGKNSSGNIELGTSFVYENALSIEIVLCATALLSERCAIAMSNK